MEGGSRTQRFTFKLPRQWSPRMTERARLAGMDDVNEWVRYHLGLALEAPIDPAPVATTNRQWERQAQRLTAACAELLAAATIIENVGRGYGDADAREHCRSIAEQLRLRSAELVSDR